MKALRLLLLLALAAAAPPAGAPAWAASGAKSATGVTAPRTFKPNLPAPGLQSPGGIVTGPGRVTPGLNCRSVCGSHCASVSCAGLNVSQCTRTRQTCRMTCTSRC